MIISDSEADTRLAVSDESHPGIRELTVSNASSLYFSTVVTAVPKFMKSSDEYQKFLAGGAKLISKIFNNEVVENKNEINDIKKIRENSISNENISPFLLPMIQNDHKITPTVNEGGLETHPRPDENRYAQHQNQNGALTDSPNVAYIKKFEKFFDFLQKTIKKISKAIKENNEKLGEGLKSPLRGINIIKHSNNSNQILDNITNIEMNEIKKIASVSKTTNVFENLITIPTTTEKMKIKLNNGTYERIRNEQDLIVHTPINESEYKTIKLKKFNGSFNTPFLQFNEKDSRKKVKVIKYEGNEDEKSLFDKRNFRDAVAKNEKESEDLNEDGCILEDQTNDSSEQPTGSVKRYNCKQKISKKSKKVKLSSESKEESKNYRNQQRKLHDKLDSVEYELLQDESPSFRQKLHSKYDSDEDSEMNSDSDENNEDPDDQITSTEPINYNEISKHESTNKHDKLNSQSFDSQIPELNSIEENVTSKYDQEVNSQSQTTNSKSQTVLYSNDEDEIFDEVLSDMLNATFSEIYHTAMTSKAMKFKNHKMKNSQKIAKPSMKLKKNDTEIPKISLTSTLLPEISSTSVISSSTITDPEFSTTMDHSSAETIATEISLSIDCKNEQISEMQRSSRTTVEIQTNKKFIESSTVSNSATYSTNEKDTDDVTMKVTEVTKALLDFTTDVDRKKESKQVLDDQGSAKIGLIQKTRKKCLRFRQGSQRRCPNEEDINMEEIISKMNKTQVFFWLFNDNFSDNFILLLKNLLKSNDY